MRRPQMESTGRFGPGLLEVGGGIVLRGFTRTYYLKQLAQQAVMNLTDLPILANEIEVY